MTHKTKWLRDRARELRQSQTDAEKKLWSALRNRQLANHKFRRQVPTGPYIADFVCLEKRIIIELDGGQHAQSPKDAARDTWLTRQGYTVLRYWNNDVLTNTEGVLSDILAHMNQPPHAASFSPARGYASAPERVAHD